MPLNKAQPNWAIQTPPPVGVNTFEDMPVLVLFLKWAV
jgi:hypothetical protein